MNNQRESGILCHISSLYGKYGIGTFGKAAYEFIDFLFSSKQKLWQILPLSYIGAGNSPYNSFSAFAGNPLFIDFDLLIEDGLLSKNDLLPITKFNQSNVEFDKVIYYNDIILHKAFINFDKANIEFIQFTEENSFWLENFACFMTIKELNNYKGRQEWKKSFKDKSLINFDELILKNKEKYYYYKIVQFLFFKQWKNIKIYANQRGIKILGDIPIYVSQDSVDVWTKPHLFQLDKDFNSTVIAGVPPDYFSSTGQLWGNPLYDWKVHKQENFEWWISRIKHNLELYDYVRIDHFRALESYWSIPANSKTAINGKWKQSFGDELLSKIIDIFGTGKIIAEDLGNITFEVKQLRDKYELPGMKILQFAFTAGFESEYLPHNLSNNIILYTGTHDNNTITGWHNDRLRDNKDKKFTLDYLDCIDDEIATKIIKVAMASVADTVIIPLQDWLNLDETSRMNTPGTINNNWTWRITDKDSLQQIQSDIAKLTELYFR